MSHLSVGDASMIVGPGLSTRGVGVFGQTSKMPGKSYGLPAAACHRGSLLAANPDSMCHPARCYAKRNFYASWTPVIKNRESHLEAVKHPRWADAMVVPMTRYLGEDDVFRWHDSGDIQGVDHLAKICDVARRTPWLLHWLPTHEPYMVLEYLNGPMHGTVPDNLTIRLSADVVGKPAGPPSLVAELRRHGVTTSTVHLDLGAPVQVSDRRRDVVECRSYLRDHQCKSCRACWSRDVASVSYPLSGTGGAEARAGRHQGRPQVHLPVVP